MKAIFIVSLIFKLIKSQKLYLTKSNLLNIAHPAHNKPNKIVKRFTLFNQEYVLLESPTNQTVPQKPLSRYKREIHRHFSSTNYDYESLSHHPEKIKFLSNFKLNDKYWSKMWYFGWSEISGSMRIQNAWDLGYSGNGVTISVLDDGLERNHPDLIKNFSWHASKDLNENDFDPLPNYNTGFNQHKNNHGTRCAGLIAARKNNKNCIVGVAHNAKIGGIRMLDGLINDVTEAEAFNFNNQNVDIYSASWGPNDDGATIDGPRTLARSALMKGIKNGRQGRGNIYVFASGNGGRNFDSCAFDGYNQSPYTISVGSASSSGTIPWYAEACASVMVTTFSTGYTSFEGKIYTTDLNGQCTDQHSGTSASAPILSGIVALTLEANPDLTWRDIQHLLVRTSKPETLVSEDWVTNSAGFRHSNYFGFGLVDAYNMIKLGQKWKTLPKKYVKSIKYKIPKKRISDSQAENKEVQYRRSLRRQHQNLRNYINRHSNFHHDQRPEILSIHKKYPKFSFLKPLNISLNVQTRLLYLEHIELTLSIKAPTRGRISVMLESPSSTLSEIVPNRAIDFSNLGFRKNKFSSVRFWGENPNGNWNLVIIYDDPSDMSSQGKYLTYLELTIHGMKYRI